MALENFDFSWHFKDIIGTTSVLGNLPSIFFVRIFSSLAIWSVKLHSLVLSYWKAGSRWQRGWWQSTCHGNWRCHYDTRRQQPQSIAATTMSKWPLTHWLSPLYFSFIKPWMFKAPSAPVPLSTFLKRYFRYTIFRVWTKSLKQCFLTAFSIILGYAKRKQSRAK